MSTAVLQLVSALLSLGFAVAALAVARRVPDVAAARRAAWSTAGIGFVLLGASSVGQAAWALVSLSAGEEAAVFAGYLRFAPALNHGRALAGIALGLLLAAVVVARRAPTPAFSRLSAAILVGAALTGVAYAWPEGPMHLPSHGPRLVTLYAVEVVVLGLVLLAAALRGGADPALFGAVTLYALMVAAAVPTLSAMTTWFPGGPAWAAPRSLQLQATIVHGAMFALALLRLAALEGIVRAPRILRPGTRPRRPVVALAPADGEQARLVGADADAARGD